MSHFKVEFIADESEELIMTKPDTSLTEYLSIFPAMQFGKPIPICFNLLLGKVIKIIINIHVNNETNTEEETFK